MDVQKIIIDDQEVEIYTSISDEAIEDNRDMFANKELTGDTIDITEIVQKINNNGDTNE